MRLWSSSLTDSLTKIVARFSPIFKAKSNEIKPSSETESSSSSPVKPEEDSNEDEVSLEVLRDKLKFLESRMGLDAEVLVALNKTLTIPQTRQKILQLFLNLVTKLEEKELNEASRTTSTTTTTTSTTVGTSTVLGKTRG